MRSLPEIGETPWKVAGMAYRPREPALFTFEDLEWRVLGLCEGHTRAQILAAVRQTDPGSPSVEDVDAILRVFEELSLVRTESECPERGVATAGEPTRQDV